MLEPWKMMSLPPPPVQTAKTTTIVDARELEHACKNITTVLIKQTPLHRESALLSRFLYKYNKKFRNDLGYRNIRKINTTLKKYLQLNLLKDVENFMAMLPQDDDYFPTRQMLEYVLVRIITFSKIMLRVCVCSKQAAIFYFDRVKRGESHWMSLMPYALLSRICSLSTVLLHHSTSWYSCLHCFVTQLQKKGLNFLPPEYQLPNDLDDWIDLKNLDNFGRFNWSTKKNTNVDLSSLDDEDFSSFDSILGYISKINEKDDIDEDRIQVSDETMHIVHIKTDHRETIVTKLDHGVPVSRENIHAKPKTEIDHGEVVSRESLNILSNFQQKMSSNKSSHYVGKVTNLKTLTCFIDEEEMYRNSGDEKSLTGHLSFMQWQALKTSMVKVCDALSKSRKVEKKIQKVWKEKCLDYL